MCLTTFIRAIGLLVLSLFIATSAHSQIIIDRDTTVGPDDNSLHGWHVIVRGATLTIDGVHELASLTVERNSNNQPGVVTHSAGFSNRDGHGVWLIVDGDVFVQGADGSLVASRINVNGRGYGEHQGPGAGTGSGSGASGSGGGHGGAGSPGTHSSSVGGGTYGSFAYPATMGSGGGPNSGSGAGGGVLRLTVGGTLTVDGSIAANGAGASTFNTTGGGAGGSVWVRSTVVTGTGVISASGGSSNNSSAGSGGGGRIAVYSCNILMSPTQVFADTNTPRPGEPGTVYYFADSIDLLEHPQSQDALPGDTVLFSVVADGEEELTYKWSFNGVFIEDDEHFFGSDTATLSISNVTCLDHAGLYEAVVTDSCGFVFSQPATLIVRETGDLNVDCVVNVSDLLILLSDWGKCTDPSDCPADLNGDGVVNVSDLLILLSNWG